MPVTIIHGQPATVRAQWPADPISAITGGVSDMGDATDIAMNLKVDLARDDDDQYLGKLQSVTPADVLYSVVGTDHVFELVVHPGDYRMLAPPTDFRLVVAVRVGADAWFTELAIGDAERVVTVAADTNRA